MQTDGTQSVHASCVAYEGKGLLILGASGCGKSTLALQFMALGCDLVADDRVILSVAHDSLIASCPQAITGLIEARGVGILNAVSAPAARVHIVVDLDKVEQDRLPQRRFITRLGQQIPLIHRVDGVHFVPAILQLLKAGWSTR